MITVHAWVFILLVSFVHQVTSDCEVLAQNPWPQPYLFVPQDATVQINCTADSSSPFWAIDLASDSTSVQYQFGRPDQMEILNAHGVYELSTIETPETIITRLLINDTAVNNQTEIHCSDEVSTLILFVFKPVRLIWKEVDMTATGINVSWTQESSDLWPGSLDTTPVYSLTISYSLNCEVISLNKSSYYFTAPEGAPFCEVYNFSVTATHTGAKADCSLPSPILSRMLPHLPDIDQVESSLTYSLTKYPNKGIILLVSFKSAFCPNHKYLLVLRNVTSNESSWQYEIFTPTPEETSFNNIKATTITTDYLTDNTVITFSLLITNNELYTATTGKDIYTTDLQAVNVVVTKASDTIEVTCDFISGSDAQGCMVVLVGQHENTTVNLTRDDECTTKPLSLTTLQNNVFGFDIEQDGSVSTLAIPGTISTRDNDDPLCLPNNTQLQINVSSTTDVPWIILIPFIAVIALLLVANVAFIIVYCYVKRFRTQNKKFADREKDEAQEAMSYYEKPEILLPKRKSLISLMSGNGTEYCRTSHAHSLHLSPSHDFSDADGVAYAKLAQDNKSHVYHVLERNRPPRGIDVTSSSQTGPNIPSDLPPPHMVKAPTTLDAPSVIPPTQKDSNVLTCIPVYDDVILKESQPSSSAVPSTPIHHPDTPPKLPPPRGSAIWCSSELPSKLPPSLYDEVLPVVARPRTKRRPHPVSPSKLPSLSCDGEASSSDSESPPPLPPPYRDSVVLTCVPLYDEVLSKEVTVVPTGSLAPDPNSPASELPLSCDGEAPSESSDAESPPPLPPPYRNSAFLMPLYDDVVLSPGPANQTSTETNAIIQGFTSPFTNCNSPPQDPIPVYKEVSEKSA